MCFVVKAEEILALNYLPVRFPRPERIEWINRATDRQLSPSSLQQLFRTYHRDDASPSVRELKQTAGVRAVFGDEATRNRFAALFAEARRREQQDRQHMATAIFTSMEDAEAAALQLLDAGFEKSALTFLWRANAFMQDDVVPPQGHSVGRVARRVTGGGLAGAAMGSAILLLPGVGQVVAAGGVLLSTYSAIATASGMIGATATAIATMLSDLDVDNYCYNHLEEQLKRGCIFLGVDVGNDATKMRKARQMLEQAGGEIAWSSRRADA